jgi:hypothetical protein
VAELVVDDVLEGVAEDIGVDVFDTALLTINWPWPASQQVALLEPQQ